VWDGTTSRKHSLVFRGPIPFHAHFSGARTARVEWFCVSRSRLGRLIEHTLSCGYDQSWFGPLCLLEPHPQLLLFARAFSAVVAGLHCPHRFQRRTALLVGTGTQADSNAATLQKPSKLGKITQSASSVKHRLDLVRATPTGFFGLRRDGIFTAASRTSSFGFRKFFREQFSRVDNLCHRGSSVVLPWQGSAISYMSVRWLHGRF